MKPFPSNRGGLFFVCFETNYIWYLRNTQFRKKCGFCGICELGVACIIKLCEGLPRFAR